MKACLSQTLTMSSRFDVDLRAFAQAGCRFVEIWLTKLETHLERHSIAETRAFFRDLGLEPLAACYQGGLLLSGSLERKVQIDQFQKRLGLCQEFGISTLVIAPDEARSASPDLLTRAVQGLKQAAQLADSFGIRLALEFRGHSTWCASLATAAALIQHADEPNLSLCLDLFHYYTGPSKPEDLQLLTAGNLGWVQVSDVASVPREFARDADRILPGDGEIAWPPIRDQLLRIGYTGGVSVEVLDPRLWSMDPHQVAATALAAVNRLLPEAATSPGRPGTSSTDR